ncbi:MAG: LamG domain-containing protein [candidate division WS1 bacterium]|nr:LamG domain-containing protein [candidate division WS1 bacterium]
MIDGDAYLPVTTNPAYVTATMPDDGSSVFPTALVVDEARGINWEGGAASFIDGLASDYSDMQVTLADGETPVPFGVEEFSQTSGSRQLVVHLGIPSLSASVGTELLLWRGVGGGPYESRSGVYSPDDGHLWYWPMNEASGDLADWTGNEYTGTRNGHVAATGVIGVGQEFNGSGDCIEVAKRNDDNVAVTCGMWVYSTRWPDYECLGRRHGTGRTALYLRQHSFGIYYWTGNTFRGLISVGINQWHYCAVVGNDSYLRTYVWDTANGLRQNDTGVPALWCAPDMVGSDHWNQAFKGTLDGYSLQTVARSAAWLQTTAQLEYYNDAFWSFGEEADTAAKRYPAARRAQIYRLGPRLVAGGILI